MRLIDADATIYALNVASRGDSKDVIRNLVICFLLASPTVDAVPVIRCKDCRWYDTTDSSGTVEPIGYRCRKVNRLWREPDDFCKGAERKEE